MRSCTGEFKKQRNYQNFKLLLNSTLINLEYLFQTISVFETLFSFKLIINIYFFYYYQIFHFVADF